MRYKNNKNNHLAVVDIVMPLYNNKDFVCEAVNSVINQKFTDWSLIIVDDGSNDSSAEEVNKIIINNRKCHLLTVCDGPKGACHARNLGFKYGGSQYVLFLDSDDLLDESCIEKRLLCMQNSQDLDFVLGNTLLFSNEKYDLNIQWNVASLNAQKDMYRFLQQDMPWNTMSPLWRRESFLQLRGWNDSLNSLQDWELHIRACYAGFRYALSSEIPDTFYRRPHSNRKSIASAYMTEKMIKSRLEAVKSVARLKGFMQSKKHREYVEGFCLRNALQILDSRSRQDSFRFLIRCILCGLFRPIHALGAIMILSRGKNWRGSGPMKRIKNILWSCDCRIDPWDKVQCSA